jgi:hypothetical protein
MVRTISDLVSEYDDLLIKIQEFVRDSRWVSVLQSWREELKSPLGKEQLGAHAKRTARALAGMESIGDIASADPNREFLAEVEDLFAKCKEIRELCEAQSGRDPNLSS